MSTLFAPDGDLWVPSGHTRGPWDPNAMHGGAPAALIARAVDGVATDGPMQTTRLTIELLRPVPIAPVSVEATVLRPGRRLQVVDVVLEADGQVCCVARAVRISVRDVDVPPAQPESPVPGPQEAQARPFDPDREMFPTTGMEVRFARGSYAEAGPALAWFRPRMPLVPGEEWTPLQRAAAAADFGNGVSQVLGWETHVFVNPDLTIHLHREPRGEWIGLDARTDALPTGIGQAVSILHDVHGRIGAAAQSLFVDAAPNR
jgi:hypothetical protein